ncbi:MAG: nicotinate-nucleotide adenylyltransferase [Anaerovoracaceae bacterium]
MKKVGVIGGSFDPVHIGHINLALDAMKQCNLERVIFVPAKLQPFKLDKEVTPAFNRVEMLEIVMSKYSGFKLSTYEMEKEEVSYTYKTLEHLRKKLDIDEELYFICGTDTFLTMKNWKEAEKILRSIGIIVGSRPGYKDEELKAMSLELKEEYDTKVLLIDNIKYDISATKIRLCNQNKESINNLVPLEIERYIKENGLYK